MYDILVVGCGLTGMVIARFLAEKGLKVHIIERRNHIGGNLYTETHYETGVQIQKYGPHVFFTDNPEIEKYVNRFCETVPFYPECRTVIDGKAIPIPFNFESIDMLYNEDSAQKLKSALIEEFGENTNVSVLDVINSNVKEIHEYGLFMYDREYRKYTSKQWGLPIESIDPKVFMRVPVYISYKKHYLNPQYQYMPLGGFTELSRKMLEHPNISVQLETEALDGLKLESSKIKYDNFEGKIVYTGPLDSLFGFKHGRLPYRALEFTWKVIPKKKVMTTPIYVFPEADKYIRIVNYSQFPPQACEKSVIAIEYPLEYRANELCGNEPYYPTLTDESKAQFSKYENLAKEIKNLYPCGRLADFKYYNMDAAILRALDVANEIITKA